MQGGSTLTTLDELIPLYLQACEVEGKTPRTVQSYRETLKHFRAAVEILTLPTEVASFKPAHVYLFMANVRARGVSDSTQHRRQREVKAFFSWCKRMDYLPDNPFMRVPMVRREQKVIQPFSREDVTRLLAACDPFTHTGCRMRALILFLLDTGVRASELSAMQLVDVSPADHRVRVLKGKGRKQRWTAISDVALSALDAYIDSFRGRQTGPLFQTVKGSPLRAGHLNILFTRLSQKSGVAHVHPHRFRHTFATWAIRASARELDVQYLLGHSSSAMLRRYTASYDSEQAAIAHATFSPASQLGTESLLA